VPELTRNDILEFIGELREDYPALYEGHLIPVDD
jgi:hypothetical protein